MFSLGLGALVFIARSQPEDVVGKPEVRNQIAGLRLRRGTGALVERGHGVDLELINQTSADVVRSRALDELRVSAHQVADDVDLLLHHHDYRQTMVPRQLSFAPNLHLNYWAKWVVAYLHLNLKVELHRKKIQASYKFVLLYN